MYQFGSFSRAEIGPPRLPKLVDGFEGVVKFEKTFVNDTRFGSKLFVELTVMSSNRPENPVGQRCVWAQDLTKRDVADNAVLQFAAAALGVNREDAAGVASLKDAMQGLLHYAINVNNDVNNFTFAMSGRYAIARARKTVTKEAKRDFFAVDFEPYVQPTNGHGS